MGTLRVALIALVAAAGGCSLATRRTLVVDARAHANHDRSFYLVVRSLKSDEFLTDGYQRIAGLVFPSKPDPSVRLVRRVSPGRRDQVKLTLPDDQPFAVYALFTEPGEAWKVLVSAPLKSRYRVIVDDNRVAVDLPRAGGNP